MNEYFTIALRIRGEISSFDAGQEVKCFMQRKHIFHVIPGLFGNISKSGNIWGGDFYRTWTVKLILPALADAQFMSFTVQVR